MKKKKSVIALLLVCLLVLWGCGNGQQTAETKQPEGNPTEGTMPEKDAVSGEDGGASENKEVQDGQGNQTESDSQTAMESQTGAESPKRPEMKGEISVNVYESSEWLNTAIAMFEMKYPNMKVNLHAFYENSGEVDPTGMTSRPAGQTREDYIAQLNTQLLSGKGDDVIITSVGFPLGRYVSMGIFEDLSAYLEAAEEINEEAYYMNIFDAYRTESGALYEMPVSVCAIPVFTFPTGFIENTGIDPTRSGEALTWREVLDFAKEMYDASTLPDTSMPSAYNIVGAQFNGLGASFVDYENQTVTVDGEKIVELLGIFEEMEQYRTGGAVNPYHISYQPDSEIALSVALGQCKAAQWKQDSGKVCLSPYYVYDFGITSQSKNKELAWEFLRFLVSEEVQTLPSCPSAGVCKAGLRVRIEGYADTLTEIDVTPELKEKMVQAADSWVSQITGYYPEDTDVLQIADGVFREYMDGALTAEQVAEELTKKLRQFISQ